MLTLVLVLGLAFVSCDSGTTGSHTHEWGNWTVTTPATCTAPGIETRICSLNSSHTEIRNTAALGHAWGAWTVTTAPTTTQAGVETRTCARDPSHTETRPVPATGGGVNNSAKTLVIAMPSTIFEYGSAGFMVGLYPVGTTRDQALAFIGLVAGADSSTPGLTYSGVNPVSLRLPLYAPGGGTRWTGSGTYDIFAAVAGGGGHYYRMGSVTFSSTVTSVQMSSANEIY